MLLAAAEKSLHHIDRPKGWPVFYSGILQTTTQQPHFSGPSKPQVIKFSSVQKLKRPLDSHWHKPFSPAKHTLDWASTNSETNHFWPKQLSQIKCPITKKFTEWVFCKFRSESGTETTREAPSAFTSFPYLHITPQPSEVTLPWAFKSWHITLYLVLWKQQRQPCPQAGRVQDQRRAQVCCQPVLTDPRDVVGVWLLFQPTLHHVPSQQSLTQQERAQNQTGQQQLLKWDKH